MDETPRLMARFTTREAAQKVNCSEPTIRKYAQILSRETGYQFRGMNEKGNRRFSEYDILLISEMKRMLDETGMDASQIAKSVIEQYGKSATPKLLQSMIRTDVSKVDFAEFVQQIGNDFWQRARSDLKTDFTEAINRSELKHEVDHLRHQIEELTATTRELASTIDKQQQKKSWWKRR